MYKKTTCVKKILALKKRKKVIQGGTSAGKTIAILIILISIAAKYPGREISVVAESVPHLRRGALKDFIKIMKETNRWNDSNFNKTLMTYTFPGTGSYIEFFSAEQEDKLRGARRTDLYMNEANNINFNAYNQLSIRTSKDIYIDFNPSNEFWAHTDLVGDEDVDYLIVNYQDNEALPETIINDIESKKEKAKTSNFWLNWWKVYGLGEIGRLEGVIFNINKIIDRVPEEAKLIGRGMDFGFTNDPTTLIACYKLDDQIIWDEEIFETGMTNMDIAKRLKQLEVGRHDFIVADSSEPKSIKEINSFGFSIKGASKGKDSILFGIDVMQGYDMNITSSSTNLIKEFRTYAWDKDKEGNKLNKPIDNYNHGIDACRYLSMAKLTKKKVNTSWGRSSI